MINLIPPEAIRAVRAEYWLRVATVWGIVWVTALLAGVGVLLSPYVLTESQVAAYQELAAAADERAANQEDTAHLLTGATTEAEIILAEASQPKFSEYFHTFMSVQQDGILLTEMAGDRAKEPQQFTLRGVAASRAALADFREELQAMSIVEDAELPISDLVGDVDITFDITITLATTTPGV